MLHSMRLKKSSIAIRRRSSHSGKIAKIEKAFDTSDFFLHKIGRAHV